jgi:hypothetical protein
LIAERFSLVVDMRWKRSTSGTFVHANVPKFWSWLIVANCAVAAASPCPQLQDAKPKQELAYLRMDRAKLDSGCIAIERLGLQHRAPIPYRYSASAEAALKLPLPYLLPISILGLPVPKIPPTELSQKIEYLGLATNIQRLPRSS